jgi:hypothetical protein
VVVRHGVVCEDCEGGCEHDDGLCNRFRVFLGCRSMIGDPCTIRPDVPDLILGCGHLIKGTVALCSQVCWCMVVRCLSL